MGEASPYLATPFRSIRAVTGWTIFFMVVLRLVIGWHFFYEGFYKLQTGGFSATPYLLASTGPLRDFFRRMVFDADGFKRMEAGYQHQQIDKRYDQIVEHYKLTPPQQQAMADFRDQKKKEVDGIVASPDFKTQLESYENLLKQVKAQRAKHDPDYLGERLAFDDKKVDKARNALLTRGAPTNPARVEDPYNEMNPIKVLSDPKVVLPLTAEQLTIGPLPSPYAYSFTGKQLTKLGVRLPPKTLTFWIDLVMMFGLLVIGACLLLGLFTRLAAFGAACFLAMFYLSMPPWLGVPDPAMVEGHYLFVNKNLIELVAVLMLATSNVGRWFGLDAFFRAWSDRRKRKRQSAMVLKTQSAPQNRLFAPEARSVRDPQNV